MLRSSSYAWSRIRPASSSEWGIVNVSGLERQPVSPTAPFRSTFHEDIDLGASASLGAAAHLTRPRTPPRLREPLVRPMARTVAAGQSLASQRLR